MTTTLTGQALSVHGQGHSLSAQIGRHARQFPHAQALTFGERHLTYAELHNRAGQLAQGLFDLGVRAGDRVAILMSNRPEFAETLVALSRLGAIAVPLNFRLSAAELKFQLDDSGAHLVLTDGDWLERTQQATQDTTVGRVVAVGLDYERLLSGPSLPEQSIDESAPAVIMYTSGTTGKPKGAMLSHDNLHAWVTARYAHLGFASTCRTSLCATPLFHIAGMASFLATSFVAGKLVLLPSGGFDPQRIVETLETEKVNYTFFVPSQWQEIVRHPSLAERTFPDFVSASWGGAPASRQLVQEILRAFPTLELWTAFGQTEICSSGTVLLAADAARKPSSIGKAMIHVEHRIVDAAMNDVAPGEVGEIVYRGPTVMLGYWNRPEATEEAFRGGWFHSGDLVRADEEGYLYVVDRIKDMIISGGENIYCAEVENVLSSHPLVGTVAVIGVPDDKWGEVPLAVIVPRTSTSPTAAQIEAFARESLASYKVPRKIVIVDQMPVNASGKILKQRLREDHGGLR